MVVDRTLDLADVDTLGEPRLEFLHLRRIRRFQPGLLDGGAKLGNLLLDCDPTGRPVGLEGRPHLRQQILVEELRDLGAPGVENPVDPEIQIGLIELEQLHQKGLQSGDLLCHQAPGNLAA